jgi:endonuclease-3
MRDDEKIIQILHKTYPDAKCSLDYRTPFQLLIATILSAQCTDERVNKVTPLLFQKYPDAKSMAKASPEAIQKIIMTTGFFRAKAKSLLGTSKALAENYKGEVPQSIEELVQLPGVGRKTANVVLGNIFNKPAGIVVDTHVKRLAFRLGWTKKKDPEKIEIELSKRFDPSLWTEVPHLLIHHGREICMARNPQCPDCPVLKLCPRKGLPKLKEIPRKSLNYGDLEAF